MGIGNSTGAVNRGVNEKLVPRSSCADVHHSHERAARENADAAAPVPGQTPTERVRPGTCS
jgi:hypothetical protein